MSDGVQDGEVVEEGAFEMGVEVEEGGEAGEDEQEEGVAGGGGGRVAVGDREHEGYVIIH